MTDSTSAIDTSSDTASTPVDAAAVEPATGDPRMVQLAQLGGSLKDLKGGEMEPEAGCPVQTVVRCAEPGEVLVIQVRPGEALQLAFEVDPANMKLVGQDLVITCPDGGEVILVGYAAAEPQLLDVNCQPMVMELAPEAGVTALADPLFRLIAQGALPQTDLPFLSTPPNDTPPPDNPPPEGEPSRFALQIQPADPEEGQLITFDVNVLTPQPVPVLVNFVAVSGTAEAGVDFADGNFEIWFPGQLTWTPMGGANGTEFLLPAGTTSFQIRLTTFDDDLLEGFEDFTITAQVLSPAFDIVTITPGTGGIQDEDLAVDISDGTGTEGGPVTFTVTLLGPGGVPVTANADVTIDLNATIAGGTDTAEASDFSATNFMVSFDGGTSWVAAGGPNGTQVTIPAGTTSVLVQVFTTGDTLPEGTETFTLTGDVINSPGYINVTVDAGNGTILDDDAAAPAPDALAQGTEVTLSGANLPIASPLFVGGSVQISGPASGNNSHVTMTMTNALSGDRLSFSSGFTVDGSGNLLLNGVATGLAASIAFAAGLIIVEIDGVDTGGFMQDALQSLTFHTLDGAMEAAGPRGIEIVVASDGVVDASPLVTTFAYDPPHFDLDMARGGPGDPAGPNFFDGLATATISGDDNDNHIVGNGGGDFIFGAGGNDILEGGVGSGQYVLAGGDGGDVLTGGNESDTLSGGSGNDTLTGGSGFDRLFGDSGDDNLAGDIFSDTLIGGAGADELAGGAHSDTFAWTSVHEVDSDGDGSVDVADVITDFVADLTPGSVFSDKIDLAGLLASLGDPGNVNGTIQAVQTGANVDLQVDLGTGLGFQTFCTVLSANEADVQAACTPAAV